MSPTLLSLGQHGVRRWASVAGMPKSPRRPEALLGKIFLGRNALRRNLLTPAELRSAAWRPLFRGVYADAALAVTLRNRCLAVCHYLLPVDGAIAGRSAAALYGAGNVDATDPVEVLVPRSSRFGPLKGLLVHTGDLSGDDVRDLNGVRVTTAARTCWDLAQWLDVVEAVVLLDILVRQRLITVAELEKYAGQRRGSRGWQRLVTAAALVDAGAESPQESRLRVRLVRAGIPAPVTQYVIERAGRFVTRVDLAWPECKVAVEYDGLWHSAGDQIHRDRRRLNRVLGSDWIVLHVTAQRLREDFDGFLAELRAVLHRRAR
jgi:very-short-patch-repair endonuclease